MHGCSTIRFPTNLVVYGPRRIVPTEPRRHRVMRGSVPSLVTQTPHNDTRLILVAVVHARRARHHRRQPDLVMCGMVRIVHEDGVKAVCFDVCFVDYVQPVVVAELVPAISEQSTAHEVTRLVVA